MTSTDEARSLDSRWAIAQDDADSSPDVRFLSEDQKWGPIDTAMVFDTEDDAVNGAETLCPAFMPGHAERVEV